jgi:hypothetical protein
MVSSAQQPDQQSKNQDWQSPSTGEKWPAGTVYFAQDGEIAVRPGAGSSAVAQAPAQAPALDRNEVAAGPVTAHFDEALGNKKWCVVDATLYANGFIVTTTDCTVKHRTEGLRARVFVVCVDDQGRAHWVSDLYQCSTCCGTWDPTCPSRRRNVFQEQFPEPVGRLTQQLQIYAESGPIGDPRRSILDAIKFGKNVYDEIKGFLDQLP